MAEENVMSISPNATTKKLPPPEGEEDQLEEQLLADGILDHVPLPMTDVADYRQWQPIPWEGKPVSETILEERR
jgi:hypothetical protein